MVSFSTQDQCDTYLHENCIAIITHPSMAADKCVIRHSKLDISVHAIIIIIIDLNDICNFSIIIYSETYPTDHP